METSTPVANRLSMAPPSTSFGAGRYEMTPLRNNRRSVAFQLDVSNDDAERAERRKSIALRRSISNLPPAVESPGLNDSVRVLSEDDIKAHLQICTKLHAENKINVKNVWSLKIIDVLRQLVAKNNPDILKVAGNSLEIAGKVYGLRVDDLHAEGLKLAGSLARNFNQRSREDEGEDDEGNVDPDAPPKDKQQKKKKLKKRRALLSGGKKHTVNPDPKSWKAPLKKLESATFSVKTDTAVSGVGNLFTNNVKMDPAGYMFKFLSKEPAWQWTPGSDPSVNQETNRKFPVKIKPVGSLLLCAPFRDFQVDEWNPDEEHKELAKKSSIRLDEVVLDDDGIPIPELDGSIHDVFQDRDDDFDDNDPMVEETAVPHIRQDIQHIVDFRPTEQSLANRSEKSEYSYNNIITTAAGKIDQIWAGPSHWKLKFIRRSQPVYTGRDVQKESEKKKGKKKKKEYARIDCRNLRPPIDFSLYEKKQPKKKKHTVDESKITLPLFDFSCQQLLENIEGLMTIPSMKPTKKCQPGVDYQVEGYRFDNPNDSAYVPQDGGNDDNGGDLGDDHFDNGDLGEPLGGAPGGQEDGARPTQGMTLVEAPETVPQSYINYATRAKRMDMKKLKQAVWCTLTNDPKYDPSAKVIPTTFSQMYKDVPKLLPEKMNQEMSCPLAFVALLHLANEQNLKLEQEDFNDFNISGPSGT